MLKQKKYKYICVFLSVLFFSMLGKVGISAYEISQAHRFIKDFQNIYSQTMSKYTLENLKEDIYFVEVGRVSSFVCHKLIKAYFPYPHRFYVQNRFINSVEAKDVCYSDDTTELIFQFSKNKQPYAHRLECEYNDDCRKGTCRLGFCFEENKTSDLKES